MHILNVLISLTLTSFHLLGASACEEKENTSLELTLHNTSPNYEINQRNKSALCERKKHKNEEIYNGKQEFKQSSSLHLAGQLNENHLTMLVDSSYTEICLIKVFGYNNGTYFYRNHLNISPETLNPNVRILTLQACGLVSKNIEKINLLIHLVELYLSANPIDDEGAKKIAELENLEVLHLGLSSISDKGLQLLTPMPNLIELDVSSNSKITDNGAQCFLTNTTLRRLNIQATNISRDTYQLLKREGLEIDYFPRPGF